MQDTELGRSLIALARAAIAGRLGLDAASARQHEALAQPGATFVTLTREGELRGCIGSLEAHRPLAEDVRENALAAAFRDPRFQPLYVQEYDLIAIEVSLLAPSSPIGFVDEDDLLLQLRPGIDGVVFQFGRHRSTFLPQVWEMLPEPKHFLAHLKRKAGLSEEFWDAGVQVFRYQVTKWRESELLPIH